MFLSKIYGEARFWALIKLHNQPPMSRGPFYKHQGGTRQAQNRILSLLPFLLQEPPMRNHHRKGAFGCHMSHCACFFDLDFSCYGIETERAFGIQGFACHKKAACARGWAPGEGRQEFHSEKKQLKKGDPISNKILERRIQFIPITIPFQETVACIKREMDFMERMRGHLEVDIARLREEAQSRVEGPGRLLGEGMAPFKLWRSGPLGQSGSDSKKLIYKHPDIGPIGVLKINIQSCKQSRNLIWNPDSASLAFILVQRAVRCVFNIFLECLFLFQSDFHFVFTKFSPKKTSN